MNKRHPANTVSSAVAALSGAATPLPVPAHVDLTEDARVFWPVVIAARARHEWSEADLVLAGSLCQCWADIREQERLLRAEGYVITNTRGAAVQNPRGQALETLTRRGLAIMRTLQMQAAVTRDATEAAPARAADRKARAALRSSDAEDLLAKPEQ